MNHWPFVVAAYAATFVGTGGILLWSWTAMRRAEREAGEVKR